MASWHTSCQARLPLKSATSPNRCSTPETHGGNLRVRFIGSRAMPASQSPPPCLRSTSPLGSNSSRPHEAALTMTNTHFAQCAPPRATSPTSVMTPLLTLLFAVAVGVIVLPLYAAQPLISSIAASFDLSSGTMGLTTTMPMVGYAAGLLLLVPLSDLLETRRLILTTLSAGAVALAAAALAPSSPFFLLAAFALGA